MLIREICHELNGIKRELQAIRKVLELSNEVSTEKINRRIQEIFQESASEK